MAIVAKTPDPELKWPRKNARSCTDLERQRNKQISENETIVRSLVWIVLTYGTEGCTLTKADGEESNVCAKRNTAAQSNVVVSV